ncbi:peptidoglycan DD-metalloendopeptidase family protein [Paenibacillus alkaliterrae]|uniref:glucosaminidase domain-containing protein n=1 Tax=Paenibacillus alkaliterrae TaxID=320909 RepID=UPI001F2D9E62|nr:glucosaminidase domain-containing protein [Paenibacillus alkaliterrae]MCF2940544.1 peptidoglycan DD-metalloendopeptidase family protein [Paenibacillus alkaliterrae]
MASFEQASEMAKELLKQHLKNQLKKQVGTQIANHFVSFWYVYLALLVIFMFFYIIAAAISSSQTVAAQTFISEKFLPPQIYIENLEESITSGFGERIHPVTGVHSFHDGIDLGIPVGTPVASSTDGVVKTVNYPKLSDTDAIKSMGIYVAIESNDSSLESAITRYLHLRDAYVIPGQIVKKGQIIGLSGNTGRSTGPHLHYELIPGEQDAVDPTPFIMMISQLTDVASEAAFDVMADINWLNVSGNNYESDQLLYISNVYVETTAPAFNEQGTIYIRDLNGGGLIGTGNGGMSGSNGAGPVITVPSSLGTLTNPFFIQWAPYAMAEEQRSGVKASVTLAQMALESAYGRSHICNNLFGIKANRSWNGPSCGATTNEQDNGGVYTIRASFRAYDSFEASLADHSNFLLLNRRYRTALSKANPFEFANELQRATYATDRQYANKLKSIMMSQNLISLDMDRGINPETGEPWTDVPYGNSTILVSSGNTEVPTVPTTPATENTSEKIVIMFGIQQAFGSYGHRVHRSRVNGQNVVSYTDMIDPFTGEPVINLVNYSNVLNYYSGETEAPRIYLKDVPDAIAVTLESDDTDDLRVTHVDYIKGQY